MEFKVRLSEIGTLRSGYVAPYATVPKTGKDSVRALQLRDVADDGHIAWKDLHHIEGIPEASRYMLEEGDVLLPLRSTRLSSLVVQNVPARTIAAGHWGLLTVDPERVDPHFLVYYLRHPATSARLARLARGTKIQFLSLSALRDFEIELPPIAVQRKIARAHTLADTITNLERDLSLARSRLLDAALLQALRSASTQNNSL